MPWTKNHKGGWKRGAREVSVYSAAGPELATVAAHSWHQSSWHRIWHRL